MKLNLGCGYRRIDDFINIDIRKECNPDLIFDLREAFPFKDESIDMILAHDVIEHIPPLNIIKLFEEIYRVLKLNSDISIVVPSTKGNGAFCDPTHISFWNKASFRYYTDDIYRSLYNIKAKFNQTYFKEFNSDPEWGIIHIHTTLKKVKLPCV